MSEVLEKMILLTILILIIVILVTVFVLATSVLGAGAIIIFGDVIVCVIFIGLFIKWLLNRK